MRASVLAAFPSFTARFEGRLPYMYTDVKGLVTTGIGNLIDPIAEALPLPWKNADGSAASQQQITDEWNRIKSAFPGVQSSGDAKIATLHLDPGDIDNLVTSKSQQNEAILKSEFPGYDSWPADAQLAILSWAWAQGPGNSGWPALTQALNASPPDFLTAAGPAGDPTNPAMRGQGWLNDTGNPGLRPRNLANKLLWSNAASVLANNLNPDALYYPNAAAPGVPGTGGAPSSPVAAIAGSAAARIVGELALIALLAGGVAFVAWSIAPEGAPWKSKLLTERDRLLARFRATLPPAAAKELATS